MAPELDEDPGSINGNFESCQVNCQENWKMPFENRTPLFGIRGVTVLCCIESEIRISGYLVSDSGELVVCFS